MLSSDWLVAAIYGSSCGSGVQERGTAVCRPLLGGIYANMQTDGRVSCLKTDSRKSCGTFRVLVGVTGSVAALKLPLLVSQLLQLPGVSCFVFSLRLMSSESSESSPFFIFTK